MSFARKLRRKLARTQQEGVRAPIRGIKELLGKRILITNDERTTTHEDLEKHLAQFNLTWTLRRLGELSEAIGERSAIALGNRPVPAYCIPYLALVAIEVSNDESGKATTHEDLAEAARIYMGIRDDDIAGDRVFEFLLRLGYQQFSESDRLHAIARAWMLYRVLWPVVPEASAIIVDDSLRAAIGVNLECFLYFSMVHVMGACKGYVLPSAGEEATISFRKRGATLGDEEKYFGAISATYADIRALAKRTHLREGLKRYRANPLQRWPLVRPDLVPDGASKPVYLAPTPWWLLRRATDGIYYDLADHFDHGGGDNPFRRAFGYVFQEYIGRLLLESHGADRVLREWTYGKKSAGRQTPDWIVLEGNRAVVIEVKQTAVTLDTKVSGDQQTLLRDLKKTLAKGQRQLLEFRDALQVRAEGLKRLQHVREVELLLVTHDKVPFANCVFRDASRELGITGADDVHICTCEELEYLQKYSWGGGMFEMLRGKRMSKEDSPRDFRDWLFARGDPGESVHPVLGRVFQELTDAWASGMAS